MTDRRTAGVDGTPGQGIETPLAIALRQWREREGLSRPGAARRLGVVHTTVRGWELHGVCPQPLQLAVIAQALGLDWSAARALAGPDRVRTTGTSGGTSASPLCRARLAAGLTMTQVARSVGVGPATVSRWENGHRMPAPAARARLARVLRLTPAELTDALALRLVGRGQGVLLPGLGTLRRESGLTQRRFRTVLAIGAATANAWEHGRMCVPAVRLADVAAVLGTDVTTLVASGSHPPLPVPARRSLSGLRQAAGLTQRELALHLGVSVRTVGHWEGGTRPVPLAAVRPMARCLRRPLSTVLAAAGLELPPLARPDAWDPDDVPHVLATLRHSSGWSAAALGRRLGVSGRSVRGWETGGPPPSPSTCARLEMIHGLPRGSLTRLVRAEPDESPSVEPRRVRAADR